MARSSHRALNFQRNLTRTITLADGRQLKSLHDAEVLRDVRDIGTESGVAIRLLLWAAETGKRDDVAAATVTVEHVLRDRGLLCGPRTLRRHDDHPASIGRTSGTGPDPAAARRAAAAGVRRIGRHRPRAVRGSDRDHDHRSAPYRARHHRAHRAGSTTGSATGRAEPRSGISTCRFRYGLAWQATGQAVRCAHRRGEQTATDRQHQRTTDGGRRRIRGEC